MPPKNEVKPINGENLTRSEVKTKNGEKQIETNENVLRSRLGANLGDFLREKAKERSLSPNIREPLKQHKPKFQISPTRGLSRDYSASKNMLDSITKGVSNFVSSI